MTFNLNNFKVKVRGENCLVVGTLSGLKTTFLFISDWWFFAWTFLKYWTCACWNNFSGLWPLTLKISRSKFRKKLPGSVYFVRSENHISIYLRLMIFKINILEMLNPCLLEKIFRVITSNLKNFKVRFQEKFIL